MLWYGVWYDMVRYDMIYDNDIIIIWYDICYDMIWYDTIWYDIFNPLNTELNPICHLLALLEYHPILRASSVKVNCNWVATRWQ